MKPSIKIFSSMLKEVPTIMRRSQYHFKTAYGNHLLNDFFDGAKANLQMTGRRLAGQWPASGRGGHLAGFAFRVGKWCGDHHFINLKR